MLHPLCNLLRDWTGPRAHNKSHIDWTENLSLLEICSSDRLVWAAEWVRGRNTTHVIVDVGRNLSPKNSWTSVWITREHRNSQKTDWLSRKRKMSLKTRLQHKEDFASSKRHNNQQWRGTKISRAWIKQIREDWKFLKIRTDKWTSD